MQLAQMGRFLTLQCSGTVRSLPADSLGKDEQDNH